MNKRAHITGTGGYQPGEPIPTSKVQELVGELIPEVAEGLSIEQRFWQIDIETGEHRENNSDLSYKAAVAALESAGVEPRHRALLPRAGLVRDGARDRQRVRLARARSHLPRQDARSDSRAGQDARLHV